MEDALVTDKAVTDKAVTDREVTDRAEEALSERMFKQPRPGQHQLLLQQWSDVCRKMKMSLREENVCKLLFDGMTRQQIADQMGISNRTVRHHMEKIHLKLNVSNRVGVVLKIIQLRDLLCAAPLMSSKVQPSPQREMRTPAEHAQTPEA